jgi:sporulation-control protein spo0M
VLSLGNKIDVSVSGLPLGQVAAKFDRLLARDVLVPASRVKRTVRLRLKGVTVSAAIRALGLRTQKKVKPRPSKRRAGR